MEADIPFSIATLRLPAALSNNSPTTSSYTSQNNNDYSSKQPRSSARNDQVDLNQKESSTSTLKKGGQAYIPSYMDVSNGPEPCVVCADAATGYHYRCMTCEGCKGFFRRTIQKNLKYHCKWNGQCVIDKNTRNQCQQCRFQKCIFTGMATDLVLNERQRVAKRKLIEENRERRKAEHIPYTQAKLTTTSTVTTNNHSPVCVTVTPPPPTITKPLGLEDEQLISKIVTAYNKTSVTIQEPVSPTLTIEPDVTRDNMEMWKQLAEVITPSIVKVVEFARNVPGFEELDMPDRILLLKSCCMEIMCLRAACRYSCTDQSLTLSNGFRLYKQQLLDETTHTSVSMLMVPIMEFAHSLSRLQLDNTEVAMLAAVLLMQSDRTGLNKPIKVEQLQEKLLAAFKRYVCEYQGNPSVQWAKILMKVTDLRTISTRHAERVLAIKLDQPAEIPPLFLEVFDETGNLPSPLLKPSDKLPLLSPFGHLPGSPGVMSPLSLSRIPSFGEIPSPLVSPALRTPSFSTATSVFWSPIPSPGGLMSPPVPSTSVSAAEQMDHSLVFSPPPPKPLL